MHNNRTFYRVLNIYSIMDLIRVWHPLLEMDRFIGGLRVALESEWQIVITALTTLAGVTPIEADTDLLGPEFPIIVMDGESITWLVHAAGEQAD